MKPVRWGVLGVAGHFLKKVYPPLAGSALAQVAAVASRSAERARSAAGRLGIGQSYGSYEELLADPSIEAVYIPLPNHLHAEWVRRAADAGKHVLCEKPLALNAGQAQACVDHARSRGVLLMEAFMYRFHPQWRLAFSLVRRGEIGQVRAVHTLISYTTTDPANIRNILSAGGGALMDIGCYAVSMARWLFQAEPGRVVALVTRDPSFGTDILTSAILDFGQGRSLLTVSTQAYSSQRVEVLGAGGRIAIWIPVNAPSDVRGRLTVTTPVGEREPELPLADQFGLEFEEFSRALREGRPVPTPPEDAVANLKVLDALMASERSGGWERP